MNSIPLVMLGGAAAFLSSFFLLSSREFFLQMPFFVPIQALAASVGAAFALFFQRVRPWRIQALIYLFLWANSLLAVLILLNPTLKESIFWLWALALFVGMCLCAANLVLLPVWIASRGEDSPYPYFVLAIGCLGSLAAPVAYLLFGSVFEGLFRAWYWKTCYVLVALLVLGFITTLWQSRAQAPLDSRGDNLIEARPSVLSRLRWVLLAGLPAGLAQSLITYVSVEIAAIPLFWIVPLALCSFTLMLAFARLTSLRPPELIWSMAIQAFGGTLVLGTISLLYYLYLNDSRQALVVPVAMCTLALLYLPHVLTGILQPLSSGLAVYLFLTDTIGGFALIAHLVAVWLGCWGCHGVLARSRPVPEYLAEYLLCIALGNLLATILNILIFPHLALNSIAEYPVFLALACVVRFLPTGTNHRLRNEHMSRNREWHPA